MLKPFDSAQLKRIDAMLKSFVDNGEVPGASLSVAYQGKEILRSMHGMADIENNIPIREDTIFRVYSMSKVVTVIAALILYERGLYKMHDPVSKYIPALKNPKVYEKDGKVRPAKREIAIRDLFTMTSGIPYPGSDSPSAREYEKAGKTHRFKTVRGMIERYGSIPLAFDPGERWLYGLSIDVIGMLVETLSGMTLGKFMQKEIFAPLKMKDASFRVSKENAPRFARMYSIGSNGFTLAPAEEDSMFEPDSLLEMGGGGLTMTLGDYKRITDMLVNNGTLDGVRILSRKTIDLMALPHLNAAQQSTHDWETQRGYNYGLGVRVMTDPAAAGYNGTVGEFGWDGLAGTYMFVDRQEQLSMVFMVQTLPGNHYIFPPKLLQMIYAGL